MYQANGSSSSPQNIHLHVADHWSTTKKLVFTALMAALAALLQSAGGLVPGIGFFISPFTTLPILLSSLVSLQYGIYSYVLTNFLLLLIEPTELFIFPFTTGTLGLALGWGLVHLKSRLINVLLSGGSLFLGICLPLYILRFPVFGPLTSHSIDIQVLSVIFIFSLVYSSIWVIFSLFFIKKIKRWFYR